MNKKIYLVGSMGSGKSSIGKLLAKKLNFPYYDLDKIIESNEKMSISKIFDTHDEKYFRKLESAALEKHSKHDKFVISTGGGCILDENNKKILKNGLVIYLKISLDAQYERIKNRSHRPLLNNNNIKETLKNLDTLRGDTYTSISNIEVDVSNLDKEHVLSSIINMLKLN
tara:strand:- start:1409 stop:1918 length:510 start_codon:yes stop_codon:yes gene_type:complete